MKRALLQAIAFVLLFGSSFWLLGHYCGARDAAETTAALRLDPGTPVDSLEYDAEASSRELFRWTPDGRLFFHDSLVAAPPGQLETYRFHLMFGELTLQQAAAIEAVLKQMFPTAIQYYSVGTDVTGIRYCGGSR